MQKVVPQLHAAAPWLWAGLSAVGWFASLWIALPLAGLVPFSGLEGGLRWDLASFLALNGLLSMAAALVIGRLVFGRWLSVGATAIGVPVLGVALAIAAELALHEWAKARFGYFDVELVGLTAGLGATLVVTAVTTFGVLVAPPGAAVAPRTAQIAVVVLVCVIIVSNVSGLGDGIDRASWPLAVLVGLSGMYLLLAVAVSLRRAFR